MECPICLSPFIHPVTASDGITYDLECIRTWYRAHPTSPFTKSNIGNLVYRNNGICQSMEISIPPNEHFDLSGNVKWSDPKKEYSPGTQRIERTQQNKKGDLLYIFIVLLPVYAPFLISLGKWGFIIFIIALVIILIFN